MKDEPNVSSSWLPRQRVRGGPGLGRGEAGAHHRARSDAQRALRHSEVRAASSRAEKVKLSLFSSTEEYLIETLPLGYVIKRKQPEFDWLRDKLSNEFPAVYIPPIESKGNKLAFLQNFLNALIEREEFRCTQVLQDFLKGGDLRSIYKSLEPKKKTPTALFEEVLNDKSSEGLANSIKERTERLKKALVDMADLGRSLAGDAG